MCCFFTFFQHMKLDGLTLEGSHALSYKRALHLSTGGWELGWGHR